MGEFIERATVFAQQGKFDKDTNKFVLDNLLAFRKEVNPIDKDDKALGADKPIPMIPVQGRYATRVGGVTPATLDRIFKNAGLNADKGVNKRLIEINKFTAQLKKGTTKGKIEQTFSQTIVLDYLRRIVQDYEASAGGFLFENWLAMVFAGTKEGGNLKTVIRAY